MKGGIIVPFMEADEICRIMRKTIPKLNKVCGDFRKRSATKRYGISENRRKTLLAKCKTNMPRIRATFKERC